MSTASCKQDRDTTGCIQANPGHAEPRLIYLVKCFNTELATMQLRAPALSLAPGP